ncbi:prepilin peptidase CpaA [Cupriavidus gilardii CR3]|uniref:Prepilin peptidase n=1 Tax=Cupriavidus gilardii TaxID=82541 RepID=A0A849B804_9BURK|nr:prepilin peptidase [Cupriavidus gilardii]ALD92516.1 prepilin peptidase CpaA [Cupriavidus gilardii CR3]QQE09361.1 prepilin peptidase [Cupriavidus sp. ISTL7]KAB0596420.1 prepilin peptidase [Cupriavidus gilardii]MCT9016740.1 prepilin peptidase [Cupriavidus gilardii]MCT9056330.1 prepilin peptidase [Cupriavidus gilardii]
MALLVTLLCVTTLWTDLHYRKVPNLALAFALIAAGLVLSLGYGSSLPLGTRALGFALGFAVMLPAYLLGRMGAGDVKFFAVVGLFIGPSGLLPVWLIGTLLAFVHACGVLALRHSAVGGWLSIAVDQWQRRFGMSTIPASDAADQTRGIPYAAYLAVGVLLWLSVGQGSS